MAIIIPIRKYLTYEELRVRWQCSDNDLRYLIVGGELKPSVKAFDRWTIPGWDIGPDFDKCEPSGEKTDAQLGYTLEVQPNGWLFLQSPKQTGPLACEFRLVSLERDPDVPVDPWDVPFASWYWLPDVMSIDAVILESVFLMDEVIRYEVTHDSNTAPESRDKPISTKELNTLLTIIAVLCKEAKLDYSVTSKTADLILSTADGMGVSIGKTTIRNYLKKIPDALGTRTR